MKRACQKRHFSKFISSLMENYGNSDFSLPKKSFTRRNVMLRNTVSVNQTKTYRPVLFNFFILLYLLMSVPARAEHEQNLTILYTGSVWGEVKPCGCNEPENLGGILRRATIIEKERSDNNNVLLLDAGDHFKETTDQGKLKAETILESLSEMAYDAALLGEKDFIYGEQILNKGLFHNWVLSNIENKKLRPGKTAKYFLKKFDNGTTVAIIGLVGPELLNTKGQTKVKIKNPEIELENILWELKVDSEKTGEEVDIVVLLTHMDKDKAKYFLKHDDVDIVINGHLDGPKLEINPEIEKKKIMVHPRDRGQFLGKISLVMKHGKIQVISNEYIRLDPKIKDSEQLQATYDKYDEKTKRTFRKWLRDTKEAEKRIFIDSIACKMCHRYEYYLWTKSKHFHSFNESLRKVNKVFDPECLECHTSGFKQDGGFMSVNITPRLADVQCEACHGPGSDHIIALMRGKSRRNDKNHKPYEKLTEASCLKCHTKSNSPEYKFATYWERIKH